MKLRRLFLASSFVVMNLLFQNCVQQNFGTSDGSSTSSVKPFSCTDLPPDVKPEIRWDWNSQLASGDYKDFNQIMASPVVGDLNGNGKPNVVVVSWTTNPALHFNPSSDSSYSKNGVLRIIDGATGKNLKSVGEESLAPFATTTPLLVDLNNDGKMEIVYLHYAKKQVIALNADGSPRWIWTIPGGAAIGGCLQGFSTADIDKNGKAEVLVGNWVLEESAARQPTVVKTLEATPNPLTCNVFATVLDPANPKFAIVDPYAVHSNTGAKLFDLSSDTAYMAVGKVRADRPGNQIIKTGSARLRIFDGLNGTLLTDVDLTAYSAYTCNAGSIGGGPASIGDFVGNGSNQIAIATGQYIMIFDGKGRLLASSRTQDCSSLVTGVTSFDFDGDGKPEILYSDEEYMRIYHYEGGELKAVAKMVNPSGTLFEYPVVADLAGNGTSQLLLVSNNYAASGFYKDAGEGNDQAIAKTVTGIRAFSPRGEYRWMPTRPIWNQYHYNASLISDRGRVLDPSVAALSWLGQTFKINQELTLTQPRCE